MSKRKTNKNKRKTNTNYIDFYDWTKEDDKIGNFHPELLFFIKND